MSMVLNSIHVLEDVVAGQDGKKKMTIIAAVLVEEVHQVGEGIRLVEEVVQIGTTIHRRVGEALQMSEELAIPGAGDSELCLARK